MNEKKKRVVRRNPSGETNKKRKNLVNIKGEKTSFSMKLRTGLAYKIFIGIILILFVYVYFFVE